MPPPACSSQGSLPPLLASAALLAAGCSGASRPDVLLVTIDTLRQDRMSLYGYARPTTPRIDALAREALIFTHAQSPRAKTTPAIASLLTGLHPHDHGVRDLALPLDRNVPVLAERFRAAGYRTIGIVGNWVLSDERSGLARGFDTWDETLPDTLGVPPDDVPQRRATSLTDAAIAALELYDPLAATDGERAPWFCWLHYMDPHGVYDPPGEHRFSPGEPDWLPETFPDDPLHSPRLADYNVPEEARGPDGRVDLARVRDLYDGEIRYVDAELGRLFDALDACGMLDDTLIVLTSDHGESLGEHLYWFEHGFYTYEVTCRVPLLVRLPNSLRFEVPAGLRHGDLSLVDLGPTLLDLVDLPALQPEPAPFAGRSRKDLVLADRPSTTPVFSEKIERADLSGSVQHKSVRRGDWKLIRRLAKHPEIPGRLVVVAEELYDLARDPGETENLARNPPPAAPLARLREDLAGFTAADRELAQLGLILEQRRADLERDDPEGVRRLEALGY